MKFSVIIPAHNEEKYIKKCLDSIKRAGLKYKDNYEIIVVINRCVDKTEYIAKRSGAIILKEDIKNIAIVRNKGIKIAKGDIIITIDADSIMSENMFFEIDKLINTKSYIGGDVIVKYERFSLGIFSTRLVFNLINYFLGFSGGLFWLLKKDFYNIDGFNKKYFYNEDLDFSRKLRKYGKQNKLKYKTLRNAYIITSSRKFDKFGDWIYFRIIFSYLKNLLFNSKNAQSFVDWFYYNIER